MPEDDDLFRTRAFTNRLDQLVEVSDELLHRHRRPADVFVERFTAAALIPVDDRERLLRRRIEAEEEMRLGEARPSV